MFTPSGRFYPDKKICFSMSDFHPASVSQLSSKTPWRFDMVHLLNLFQVESCLECGDDVSFTFPSKVALINQSDGFLTD